MVVYKSINKIYTEPPNRRLLWKQWEAQLSQECCSIPVPMTLCEPAYIRPECWNLSKERDSTISTVLFISCLIAFLAIAKTRDCLLVNLGYIARGTDKTHRIELIKIQQKTKWGTENRLNVKTGRQYQTMWKQRIVK